MIDNDYMNSRFEKWKKQLNDPNVDPKELENTLEELHKSFAFLSQEDQKFANLFLHDVQTGDAKLSPGMTFRDYIVSYGKKEKKGTRQKGGPLPGRVRGTAYGYDECARQPGQAE